MADDTLADTRTGKNGRQALVRMLRQDVFRRIAGYEDANDADALGSARTGFESNGVLRRRG
jgi:hypothetical protein